MMRSLTARTRLGRRRARERSFLTGGTLVRILVSFVILMGQAMSAGAHHSGAMFDRAKTLRLVGTVIEFQFVSPHSWISVLAQVDGKGEKARWDVESVAAGRLKLYGVTPENLKVGDKVTLLVNPLRDGRKGASLLELTLANGKTVINNTTKLKVGQ